MTPTQETVLAMACEGKTIREIMAATGMSRWKVRHALRDRPPEPWNVHRKRISSDAQELMVRDALDLRRHISAEVISRDHGVSRSYLNMVRTGRYLRDVLPELMRMEPKSRRATAKSVDTVEMYCAGCVHFTGKLDRPCGLELPEGGKAAAKGCAAFYAVRVAA